MNYINTALLLICIYLIPSSMIQVKEVIPEVYMEYKRAVLACANQEEFIFWVDQEPIQLQCKRVPYNHQLKGRYAR